MPGNLDFKVPQGSSFVAGIQVLENDGDSSLPLDLTGFTMDMQVRTKTSSPDIVLEASTANGKIVIDNAANGHIIVTFTKAETAALKPRNYVYDIEYTTASDATDRVLEGKFIVSAEVTR